VQGAGSAASAPVQAVDTTDALLDTVALAVGVFMHRFSLGRADALARLRRNAGVEGRSLQAQAERIVQAVEDLAGGADA
jgi:response regulator NasT